ncbi:CopG family transcriptional regulator [Streptomyces sp. NPDC029216]|uniref:CopG family transcriptional regulator n=1 Tax=Streptomyces sp. NPDC029216 TaxID=3154701 RepID=UPI0033E5EB26
MSGNPGEEHARRIDALQRGQDSLRVDTERALSDLTSKLSDVTRAVERLKAGEQSATRRAKGFEAELAEAKEAAEVRAVQLEKALASANTDVQWLAARVAALERHLRNAEGAAAVDLDSDPSGELRGLALTIEEGLTAEETLFSDHERSVLRHRITRHEQARQALATYRARVREAAAVLASTAAGDPGRKKAEAAFTRASRAAQKGQGRIAELTANARRAEDELAMDDAGRAASAAVVEAGRQAHAQLRERLRGRLSDALVRGDLLPLWFSTTLGPAAPPHRTEAWLETALDVLAYRVTYRITDPVLALGGSPDGRDEPRRAAWFDGLGRALRDWR